MIVAQQRLVDFRTVGVAHHRVIAATIAGIVEALVADAADVVGLDQPGEAVPAPALEAGAGAQGLCVGMVEGVVLIDVLVAITQIEDRLALGEQVGKGFFGLGHSWRSRGQQQRAKQQGVGTHGGFPGNFFRAHLSRAASTGVLAAALGGSGRGVTGWSIRRRRASWRSAVARGRAAVRHFPAPAARSAARHQPALAPRSAG
ncbi:hypothetical protein D3C85_1319900 [compost metagenome]